MEKKTVAELIEEQGTLLHNSNAANIAAAILKAKDALGELEHDTTWWRNHLSNLAVFAEKGDMTDTTAVKELFDGVPPAFKKRNW